MNAVTRSSSQSQTDSLQLAQRLIEVGIALSAESDLTHLLQMIMTYAQELTCCDAGTLYLRDGEQLSFFISQTRAQHDWVLSDQRIPLSEKSIAGYVVLTGHPLNIADAYQLDSGLPYSFNAEIDRQTGYRTRSLLTVPMRNASGDVIGALQLLNRLHQDRPASLLASELSAWVLPFSELDVSVAESLASQAAVAYQNVRLREELKSAHYETIFCLSVAAEYRDQDTSFHLKRMSNYSRIIARHLGLPAQEQELIYYASPMHDVGKIGIPDAVLLKPGPLTPEERLVMQQHPVIGAEILSKSDSDLMRKSAVIALSHHEKFDGSGYPQQLQGEAIPLEGRIVALADVFDALASRRPYKEAWNLGEIFTWIGDQTGSHFDPAVVAAFDRGQSDILEIYHRYQEPSPA
jgi:HD-GYP domain-containing protein (c-di-GMP phosphodiesterase class II)